MIPLLFYIFLKKYHNQIRLVKNSEISKLISTKFYLILLSCMILLLLIPIVSKTQNQPLNYKIVQGGDDIGWLKLEKNITGKTITLLLVSEIKTRFFFLITMCAKETSTYENGKMIYSSQFRKTNGSTKLNKQTRFIAEKYEVERNGEKEVLIIPFISTNLLCLYFQEPAGVSQVYCDNHESFVKIIKTDDGGYKVKFPDGNSNCYYYRGGICTKIKISHTFYSAEIILKP